MKHLTSGETSLFVTLGELDVEVRNQRVDVVISLDLQAERWGKTEVLHLHRVDIHFLQEGNKKHKQNSVTAGQRSKKVLPVNQALFFLNKYLKEYALCQRLA